MRATETKQLGVLTEACNPSTGEVGSEGSEVGHPWLLIEFKASLDYLFQNKNKTYSLLEKNQAASIGPC